MTSGREPARGDLPPLPPRPADGHKGTFGRVVALAGSDRFSGAAVLVARAALRSGAGLAVIACPARVLPQIAARVMAEITEPLPDAPPGVLATVSVRRALELAGAADAVALGPGLSDDPRALDFARAVTLRCTRPLVLDADGLNAFAGRLEELAACPAPLVLTPHPGEAARLLGVSAADVQRDRAGAVSELARRSGATCLLKGAATLVAEGTRRARNGTGNSGMATGGSGDVLTGVIAALLAQGMAPFEAAVLGAHLHGRAGDLAAAVTGERSLIATDLLDHLQDAFLER